MKAEKSKGHGQGPEGNTLQQRSRAEFVGRFLAHVSQARWLIHVSRYLRGEAQAEQKEPKSQVSVIEVKRRFDDANSGAQYRQTSNRVTENKLRVKKRLPVHRLAHTGASAP
jgi:hypothetical protein